MQEPFTQWHVSEKQMALHYNSELAFIFKSELQDIQAFIGAAKLSSALQAYACCAELLKRRQEQHAKAAKATAKAKKWYLPETIIQNEKQEKAKAEVGFTIGGGSAFIAIRCAGSGA
mgnify:CR=1 FL=1